MLTTTYIYTQFNDFACICWWVGGLMHQLTPSVYTSIHLSKHHPFYLHIHKVLHIGLFMGWLSYVPPTTKIHTYSVKSIHLSIIQIHLYSPLNLSIHPYTVYLYIQTLTHPSIYRLIHTYIYISIYILYRRKFKKTPLIMCPLWGKLKIFSILAI